MIAGLLHQGSGVGDQLMRLITTRVLAEAKGYQWGMLGQDNFKGTFFSNCDLGLSVFEPPKKRWFEKDVRDPRGIDIRSYDPEINFVEDDTVIDGCFEDFKYWGHRLDDICEWLQVENLAMPNNLCVIGFRGGEYATVPDLFLPREYWQKAIELMMKRHPGIKFEVHTDDPNTAKAVLGDLVPVYTPYIRNVGMNWRSVRYARHLIIANSAFYIMPSLLNESADEIIAPRYWARRNLGVWARPACYYPDKRIQYI